jgi:hypothetical protein
MQLTHQPACLVLSRQALPTFDRQKYVSAAGLARGAYVMADSGGEPQVILIGTGSEVRLCVDAFEKLSSEGIRARVVSMPSWELFEQQDVAYRESVLPPEVTARVAVEQGSVIGWTAMPARPARSSACTPSAPRRRSPSCSASSASRPTRCTRRPRRSSRSIRRKTAGHPLRRRSLRRRPCNSE